MSLNDKTYFVLIQGTVVKETCFNLISNVAKTKISTHNFAENINLVDNQTNLYLFVYVHVSVYVSSMKHSCCNVLKMLNFKQFVPLIFGIVNKLFCLLGFVNVTTIMSCVCD